MSEYNTYTDTLQQDAENNLKYLTIFPLVQGIGYIYHLIDEFDKVIYVGQSINLYSRIGCHLKDKKFSKVRFRSVNINEMDDEEVRDIIFYQPILNDRVDRNSILHSFNHYKLIYPRLKGKKWIFKNACKTLGISQPLPGYYYHNDVRKILDHLIKGGK